jgi:hypothetical protein
MDSLQNQIDELQQRVNVETCPDRRALLTDRLITLHRIRRQQLQLDNEESRILLRQHLSQHIRDNPARVEAVINELARLNPRQLNQQPQQQQQPPPPPK